jgi:hypothetical protein
LDCKPIRGSDKISSSRKITVFIYSVLLFLTLRCYPRDIIPKASTTHTTIRTIRPNKALVLGAVRVGAVRKSRRACQKIASISISIECSCFPPLNIIAIGGGWVAWYKLNVYSIHNLKFNSLLVGLRIRIRVLSRFHQLYKSTGRFQLAR